MPASYPTSIKSFTTKVDLVNTVMAVDINDVQNEIVAIENALGTNPVAWSNWTCTLTGSGGSIGTYAEGSAYARYRVLRDMCFMTARKQVTNLGSWSGDVRISLPVTSVLGTAPWYGVGYIYASGAAVNNPKAIIQLTAGTFTNAYKTILGLIQWADLAINDWFFINGFYSI